MAAKKVTYTDVHGNQIPEEELPRQFVALADGTMIPAAAHTDEEQEKLWIWTDGADGPTMIELFPIVTDAEKTKVIRYYLMGEMKFEWKKYTTLAAISQIGSGTVKIAMKK